MNIKSIYLHGLTWLIGLVLSVSVSADADERKTIRVGGSAESTYDIRIADLEILISLLFNETYRNDNYQLKVKIYERDEMLEGQLASGKLDATFMNPIFYLENIGYLNDNFTYAVQHGSSIKPKYVLLVRRDSGINSLEGLRDKKLIVPSGHMVGQRFLDVELLRAGMPVAAESFSEIRYTSETNAAIINLFFGQVDAALVTDFSYEVESELNRQIPKSLQIIRTSQPLIHMVIGIRKGFPPHLVEKYLPFAESLKKFPRLRYLKKTFRFAGVKKITNDDLLTLVNLNKEYAQLKNEVASQ
ncbi:MAG: PhnD/SsuA/transferrin family substrate-binding protein [Candidatus Thiodiazotropha sp.]